MRVMSFLLGLFLAANATYAYEFKTVEGKLFSEKITWALAQLYKGELALPTAQLQQEFLKLPRQQENELEDLLEAKYALLHFHDQLLRASERQWVFAEKYLALLQNLIESKVYLSPLRFEQILRNYPRRKNAELEVKIRRKLSELVAAQGNPGFIPIAQHFGLALPQQKYFGELSEAMEVEDYSDADLALGLADIVRSKDWYLDHAHENYFMAKDHSGVWYRKTFFRTGDILGTRLNIPDDGLFSSFSLPKKYLGHTGVFVMLNVHGQWVPMVLEATGRTIAAVPLRYYLSPEKSRFIEIYRFKEELPSDYPEKISEIAHDLIGRPRGYNLAGPKGYPDYLTCVEVARFTYEKLGFDVLKGTSRWPTAQATKNFEAIGMNVGIFLTPTDVVLDPAFKAVGLLDNASLTSLVSAHLLTDRLGFISSSYQLRPTINFSEHFFPTLVNELKAFVFDQMKAGTPVLSSFFLFLSDLDWEWLPGGETYFVTFVNALSVASEEIGHNAEERLSPILEQKMNQRAFSFWDLHNDPKINRVLNDLTQGFRHGFENETN